MDRAYSNKKPQHPEPARGTRLVEELQMFDHRIIDWAINQWCPRLRLCVREQGGHFEHQLYSVA